MKTLLKPTTLFAALIIALAGTFTACKKDKNAKEAEGIIMNTGSPAADGCGWLIQMNNVMYSPDNLPASFMQDSMRVKVTYNTLTSRFSCGMIAGNGFPQIHLSNIRKK